MIPTCDPPLEREWSGESNLARAHTANAKQGNAQAALLLSVQFADCASGGVCVTSLEAQRSWVLQVRPRQAAWVVVSAAAVRLCLYACWSMHVLRACAMTGRSRPGAICCVLCCVPGRQQDVQQLGTGGGLAGSRCCASWRWSEGKGAELALGQAHMIVTATENAERLKDSTQQFHTQQFYTHCPATHLAQHPPCACMCARHPMNAQHSLLQYNNRVVTRNTTTMRGRLPAAE